VPARYKDFVRVVTREYGFTVVPGGKHNVKLEKPGCRTYALPTHNGLKDEMSDIYINAFCRQYNIDPKELRAKL
jgi:hypothetical protein